jgi:hypothetical protein
MLDSNVIISKSISSFELAIKWIFQLEGRRCCMQLLIQQSWFHKTNQSSSHRISKLSPISCLGLLKTTLSKYGFKNQRYRPILSTYITRPAVAGKVGCVKILVAIFDSLNQTFGWLDQNYLVGWIIIVWLKRFGWITLVCWKDLAKCVSVIYSYLCLWTRQFILHIGFLVIMTTNDC